MNKLPDDFKEIVKIKKIRAWSVDECAKCHAKFNFMFRQGKVFFDGTCDCSPRDKSRISTWGEVAEVYNNQQSLVLKEKYQLFWKLD
ncbi:MAG: hypothetical protein COB83_13085 [Gammaproteobacteria bacterium]|nr:MAG: hypothetical protein COB83_13085 [Gammaproteobacteria bacterium]